VRPDFAVPPDDRPPDFLTLAEAGAVLRFSRGIADESALEFLATQSRATFAIALPVASVTSMSHATGPRVGRSSRVEQPSIPFGASTLMTSTATARPDSDSWTDECTGTQSCGGRR